jgi:hypothetical protein
MSKAERINRVINSLHTEDELVRRLPEVDAIYDEDLKDMVVRTYLDGCPDSFWERPSSSTGKYHSDDECGKHGNWLHTKRVFAKYCDLSQSYVENGVMTEWEREAGKAAALIHDMMKYGWPSEGRDHTTNEHDVIAADVARNIGGAPNEVYHLVHAHMGPWGEGMEPANERHWLLHFADKAACGVKEDNIAVYYPAEELTNEWPDIVQINHEDGDKI